jgi:serine/threonine protein phosphatase PrpC
MGKTLVNTANAPEDLPFHSATLPQGVRPWRVAAASVCGTSHAKIGKPCQDTYRWAVLPEGTLVAAVADGAGSAAHAEVGAARAAQTAVDTLRARLAQLPLPQDDTGWRTLLSETMEAARTALDTDARATGYPGA